MSSDPIAATQAAAQTAANTTADSVSTAASTTVHTISSISFTAIDYLLLAIIVASILISIWRGFLKEALSLLVWVVAVAVSLAIVGDLADIFSAKLHDPKTRYYLSFAILMSSSLGIGGMINLVVTSVVKKTGFSSTDRILGVVFGLTRGVMVISIILLCASFTTLPDTNWWNSSFLIPEFMGVTHWLQGFVPGGIG